jgi:hypothetical protein
MSFAQRAGRAAEPAAAAAPVAGVVALKAAQSGAAAPEAPQGAGGADAFVDAAAGPEVEQPDGSDWSPAPDAEPELLVVAADELVAWP